MIVNSNQDRDNYNKLFIESYNYLVDKGKIIDTDDKNSFSSLPEYYSHMNDFFTTGGYKYVFLPLEEKEFIIDLNKRSITIPTEFNKLVSVQSDKLAEMIIFSVDRYFDYMDLANTNIYVQWKTPDMAKDDPGHATRIYMIDLSTPDKIRFAWPISDVLTKTPGVVKFSVRFFRISSEENMIYSLNTLESSFNIAAAHQATLNDKANVEIQEGLFEDVIINSMYSHEGAPLPLTPSFIGDNNGVTIYKKINIEGEDKLTAITKTNLENDTLTLYAEASVMDMGDFIYKWYYLPFSAENDEKPLEIQNDLKYGIGSEYVAYPAPLDEEGNIDWSKGYIPGYRYYKKETPGNGGTAYKLVADVPGSKESILYRQFSTLTIKPLPLNDDEIQPELKEVVGIYFARVYNKMSSNINPNYGTTTDCILPSPGIVTIQKDLSITQNFLNDKNNYTLSIEPNEMENNENIQYQWYKINYDTNSPIKEKINNATQKEYMVDQPGYYMVELIAEANRKFTDVIPSKTAKVTKQPEVLVFDFEEEPNQQFDPNNHLYILDHIENEIQEIEFNLLNNFIPNEHSLVCEEITYQWYFKELDSSPEDNTWVLLENETSNIFMIKGKKNSEGKEIIRQPGLYAPVATNHLNGTEVSNNIEDEKGNRNIFITII